VFYELANVSASNCITGMYEILDERVQSRCSQRSGFAPVLLPEHMLEKGAIKQ
jgi:hypothetical protein